ncbi:glycoside hydrolase family 36 protein [Chloroflexota bacterium]
MKFTQSIAGQSILFECERFTKNKLGLFLQGNKVSIHTPFPIKEFYQHGWQSWSLSAWIEPGNYPGVSYPQPLNVLQIDQPYSKLDHPNGSWLGAVSDLGGKILFLGALNLDSHVELNGDTLIGKYENGTGAWFVTYGEEKKVFESYVSLIKKEFGSTKTKESPTVWCSWYSLYEEISEDYLHKICNDLGDYPFDVIQIDDGWQEKVGDWKPNAKFPSGMKSLAKHINNSGKKAGLWLAPLLVVPSSKIFNEHPDWLLRSEDGDPVCAGFNWNEKLYALDTTHPRVQKWLSELMKDVRNWGFEYIKLDFLYAGALKGIRWNPMPRESAFRLGLQIMRESLQDAFLLICGTPILPSIGLCDAIRVGPDVSGSWRPYIENLLLNNYSVPSVQNAIRTSINRLWLKPIVQTDPDVVYFQSQNNTLTNSQKDLLRTLSIIANFKATSDLSHLNSPDEKKALFDFLLKDIEIDQIDRYVFTINGKPYDFSDSVKLLPALNPAESILRVVVQYISKFIIVLRIFGKISSHLRKRSIRRIFK